MAVDIPEGQSPSKQETQIPIGQTKKEDLTTNQRTGAEVFGAKGGYIHPFLIVEERYTDNLYFTKTDKEDDFITTISPGIWLALPSNREKLLDIGTSTISPGGLKVSRSKPETTRRYQSYLLYAPELVYYANHSTNDSVNHKAEGLFQYNFNMGLSIDIVDQFNVRHEVNDNGISRRVDKYQDNFFGFLASYDPSERFRLRFDYSNYALDYKDVINNFRDRTDNTFAGYLFYKFAPKTSAFVEYEFADIQYDMDLEYNSTENRYYTGIDWDVTAKTKGQVKLGYIEKNFDAPGIGNKSAMALEIQAQHNFNPKRAIKIVGFRKFNESSLISAYTALSTGVSAAWLQRFTEKWSGTFNVSYTRDDYKGLFTINGKTDERADDIFSIGPAIRFKAKEWLYFDLAYTYLQRDSNFNLFDYDNNIIFLKMTISM